MNKHFYLTEKVRRKRCFLALLVVLCFASPIYAEDEEKNGEEAYHSLSFARWVYNAPGRFEVDIAPETFRIKFLKELRRRGFNAKGAENLVFGKDESDQARMWLGATVVGGDCEHISVNGMGSCWFETKWELYDSRQKKVIFKTSTETTKRVSLKKDDLAQSSQILALAALRDVADNIEFQKVLKTDGDTSNDIDYEMATFLKCESKTRELPKNMSDILDATVLITAGNSIGAGFLISTDGLVLTAYHVIDGATDIKITTHKGQEMDVELLRYNRKFDLALLSTSSKHNACLPLDSAAPKIGEEIYAIGTPLDSSLKFSVSKGVVSGMREFEDHKFIQTDASINPGNSGGPLVSKNGSVLGVVRLKVPFRGFEGLGFGVPIDYALKILALSSDNKTAFKSLMANVEQKNEKE